MRCEKIISNSKWDKLKEPYITVVTPIFNREDTILRAMESIKRQTYNNYEYIVVNDGSTDKSEDIILKFLNENSVPMLYIKKANGGVHTARNLAVKYARGKMYYCNDSDDESLPNALSILVEHWKKISNRSDYFEIKARCINEKGVEVGPKFPDDINQRPWEEIKKFYNNYYYENVGFRRIDVMKSNPWPEPQGVTFVNENIIWKKIRNSYKTYLINDVVQIYHTEGNDHLDSTLTTKRSLQHCVNSYWNSSFILDNYREYSLTWIKILRFALIRDTMANIIKKYNKSKVIYNLRELFPIRVACRIMSIPAKFATHIYVVKYRVA